MIQFLRGSKSQLESSSTIIAAGQPVFESDTGQLKIGTGSSRYSSLPYVGSIFEYDPGSGGGSSSDITWSGNSTNGYIDFPNGLRYSWGRLDTSGWGGTPIDYADNGIYTYSSTVSFLGLIDRSGASTNWKSVVVDSVITMAEASNYFGWVGPADLDSSAASALKFFTFDNQLKDVILKWHVWSHD